jgi:hypothetical protein
MVVVILAVAEDHLAVAVAAVEEDKITNYQNLITIFKIYKMKRQ